jgi:Rod binding domain-containing protein
LSDKISSLNIQSQPLQKINEKYKHVPKEIIDVAEGMESQFINHMINEMRKSVNKTKPESQAERFYNSKIDEEYSKIMSETKNGLGLKEMIIEQLAPQYIRKPQLAQTKAGLRTYQEQNVDSTKGGSHE